MIVLIDNYDSFTYNLYQLAAEIMPDIQVFRNDKITIEQIEKLHPTHIIISPGPGKPHDAGISEAVIENFRGRIPILGVCLGHQAIWEIYGGTVGYAKTLIHGKPSDIAVIAESVLFSGMGNSFPAARYHSLAASGTVPELAITAVSDDGEIMAVEDSKNGVFGVQFHPESVMTPTGNIILKNFLEVTQK
jgi:anthranilate synthase component 2